MLFVFDIQKLHLVYTSVADIEPMTCLDFHWASGEMSGQGDEGCILYMAINVKMPDIREED